MIEWIKQTFYEYVREFGYNIGDVWTKREALPHINIRIGGAHTNNKRGVKDITITLTLDIFSDYKGEKEILDIVETLNNGLDAFRDAHKQIINADMSSLHILDDNDAGVLRKHGVISYTFNLARGDE